jgi:putative heme iron utilization protein
MSGTPSNPLGTEEAIPPAPPRDPRQPVDFEPLVLARELLRLARVGSLGTVEVSTGFPMVTLTSVATDYDGVPLVLTSRLSHHTQNLLADPRGSLLLARGGKGDPLAHPRLSLRFLAEPVSAPRVRHRFLARQPKAKLYVDFPDFLFFRLMPQSLHLNGGFARAYSGDAAPILSVVPDLEAFEALEISAIAHMNEDHADALSLYATQLCGMPAGPWRAVGMDPGGLDLMAGERVARLSFDRPVLESRDLRGVLKDLAEKARAKEAMA